MMYKKYFTRKELLKQASQYFTKGIKVMLATSDGNYFYEHAKQHAYNHKNSDKKIELFTLTIDEYNNLFNKPKGKAEIKKETKLFETKNVKNINQVKKTKPKD